MRRHKIVKVNIADIIVDPAGQSEMVDVACHRNPASFVTGLCQVGDELLLSLEALDGDVACLEGEYVFAPFDSGNIDDVVKEIGVRYFSDFSLVGGFEVKRSLWALFRRLAGNVESD
jgi:hypothetical protein